MTSNEIRKQFLDFFASKGHHIVPSAPIVVKDDPTLMFINSGMAPFKDYFLGNKPAPYKRIADTQKCLRVSGKHNDLEEVGYDTYHHTMFEMLGNWSFGDYFKKDALHWAWELLTEVYKLPKDRLYVSVFGGDPSENLERDMESFELWKGILGSEERILFGSKKDNFWEMGDTGPCGPCSEIHIDLRSEEEVAKTPGKDLVNNDHPQVVEIWNNVFMEFNRLQDGSLVKLPAQHVDTGMGFERLCMAIEGKQSNYDTSVFQPLIQFISDAAGLKYGENEKTDIATRVIADHIRTLSFAIADGQLPSNNKAGYVIRRILRRAVRYAFTFLNFKKPFFYSIVPTLADQMASVFPELKQQQSFVMRVIEEEEIAFLRTLENGLKKVANLIVKKFTDYVEELPFTEYQKIENFNIDNLKADIIRLFTWEVSDSLNVDLHTTPPLSRPGLDEDYAKTKTEFKAKGQIIDGKTAFELYDTFGFPFDLISLIAKEQGLTVDESGFNIEMEQQKNRSRNASVSEQSDWVIVNDEAETEFIGYDHETTETRMLRYRKVSTKGKTEYHIVLEKTPFYAESGGQVGDTGFLESGLSKVKVIDTRKENDLIIHVTTELPEDVNAPLYVKIDANRRKVIKKNHSATHLLHAALRNHLGEHVHQKGSLVNDKLLRFDFSHFTKVTDEQIREIERMVNSKIRENIALDEKRNVPIAEAKQHGAMALFGEKYGEFVRVITFDKDHSVELCGGTHVKSTGEIGFFKIVSESSVAAGVRRIEAVTANAAEEFVHEQLAQLEEVKQLLGSPQTLSKTVEKVLEENSALKKQLEQFELKQVTVLKNVLAAEAQNINGINFIARNVELGSADYVKKLAFDLRQSVDNLFLVLAAEIDGKPQLTVMLSDNLVSEKGLNAMQIVKELAKEIQGGGGGQPFYATAGGKNAAGLANVPAKAEAFVKGIV